MQTIPSIDLYRELEVDRAATSETIDAAWKSLLKRHHPDVAPDAVAAHERVKRLNLAHDWLSDPDKRAAYDRARRRSTVTITPRTGNGAGRSGPDGSGQSVSPQPAGGRAANLVDHRASAGVDATGNGTSDHNPYSEYEQPVRRASPDRNPDGTTRPPRRRGAAIVPLLAPLALASVLIVVAIASFMGSTQQVPAAAGTTTRPSTATATLPLPTVIGGIESDVTDPRDLPPPDPLAALPASCKVPDPKNIFTFETHEADLPAQVFVAQCDATHSYGPLVYQPGVSAWKLVAKGKLREALPYRAFSGGLSGRSADEFGIAWTRGDPDRSTVSLYRLANGIQEFWDSGSVGLQWTLATYQYLAGPVSSAPGLLVVRFADLTTGTPNCATCRDHVLWRDTYAWGTLAGTSRLVLKSHDDAGLGPG